MVSLGRIQRESNHTAAKRKGKNNLNLAYGQLAHSIIGDEIDGPRLSISPKKICQEDPLLKLAARVSEIPKHLLERAERAIKRRARILEEIKIISQLPDAVPDTVPPPDAAELSHAELLCAAAQLSNPAIQVKFPFPFVGDSIPERFNYSGDHGYWDYVGREKFAELVDAIDVLETTHWRGYLFYGTIGYGKSHLLAMLACYLISAGKRIIYIPDCRECAWRPVDYLKAAMLLAWGRREDSAMRQKLLALDTTEAISQFFGAQSSTKIIFLIDQMNALEMDPSGIDGLNDATKTTIYMWIRECVAPHKYIFSASANNRNRYWLTGKQTGARQLLVYGGFSAVCPYTRCVECRIC